MNNQQVFIPTHGIGGSYLDLSNMYWYMYNSSYYNLKKEISFFKLLLDMGSLYMRCYIRLNEQPTDIYHRILMFDFTKRSTYLIRSFIKNESLAKDLFCTGDIETLDYCIDVYQQSINKKKLDSFIEESQELKLAFNKLKDELSNFEFYLENLLTTLYFFLTKKYRKHVFISEKYQESLNKIKQVFLMDLQNQFRKLIKKMEISLR